MNTRALSANRHILSTMLLSVIGILCLYFFINWQVLKTQIQQVKIAQTYLSQVEIEQLPNALQLFTEAGHLAYFEVINEDTRTIYLHVSAKETFLSNLFTNEMTQSSTSQKLSFKLKTLTQNYGVLFITQSVILIVILFSLALLINRKNAKNTKKSLIELDSNINQKFTIAFDATSNESTEPSEKLPSIDNGINNVKAQIKQQAVISSTLIDEASLDPLTKTENRTRFVQFFESKSKAISTGVLTITRCSELQTVNKTHGFSEGDQYIINVANIIKEVGASFGITKVFRLNSSDFATLLLNTTLEEAENFTEELTEKFNAYQQNSEYDSIAFTGLVAFDNEHPLGELLALADTGISVAQTQLANAWHSQADSNILADSNVSYGNQNWRQEIDSVIENQRIKLFTQPILPTKNNKAYDEILARFLSPFDDTFPTISFIAMAEKLDKIVEIDRLIIDKAITEIHNKENNDKCYGINISARTIQDEHFLIWLERRLLRESHITSQLVFEISEFGLQQNIKISKRFIDMLHRVGARLTVERFGVGLTSFKFFRDIKPDFIKMDSAYTRDIDEDKNNQYFLRLMVDLAHRLGIKVLVESVESQNEKLTLEKLFIDGYQGFYLGKPEVL